LSDETGVGQLLPRDLAENVASIIRGDFARGPWGNWFRRSWMSTVWITMLRDSLMTGAKYGIFDLEWIIKSIEINEKDDHLYISAPGLYSPSKITCRHGITCTGRFTFTARCGPPRRF
jgi:hypothetical protein